MAPDQRPNGGATADITILEFKTLLRPGEVEKEFPLSEKARQTVLVGREEVRQAIVTRDPRLVVVTGPCSIHEPDSALEYARRLVELRRAVSGSLNLVMRV